MNMHRLGDVARDVVAMFDKRGGSIPDSIERLRAAIPKNQRGTVTPIDINDQACLALYRAQRYVAEQYKPLLLALELTLPQYLLLLHLWQKDRVSIADLGRALDLDSGTLTPMLKRMERRGLIAKKRSTSDYREVLVSLTDEGRRLEKASAPPRSVGKLDAADVVAALVLA
jgi:DNA-binding MarR family transcriptional regulator